MKRIRTIKQLQNLKDGIIILQVYHRLSIDDSKFDINKKERTNVILLEEIGGLKKSRRKTKTPIISIDIKDKNICLFIADIWLQDLYKIRRRCV